MKFSPDGDFFATAGKVNNFGMTELSFFRKVMK